MEGEFGKVERLPDTPLSIIGEELFTSLKELLPHVMSGQSLNASKILKGAEDGVRIRFFNTNGSELTDEDWHQAQAEATGMFYAIRDYKYPEDPAYAALEISFIDRDERDQRQIVIKSII
jgi:hypothetical protein